MIYLLLWIILWIICGIIGAGFANPRFLSKYDTYQSARENLGVSLLIGLFGGPIALLILFFITGFGAYGWTLYVCDPRDYKK